jgi:hypothetical protein
MKNDLEVNDERVRISPRISRKTRALAKAVYPLLGVTLEDRIESLLTKDLNREMKKTWFKSLWLNKSSDVKSPGLEGAWKEDL